MAGSVNVEYAYPFLSAVQNDGHRQNLKLATSGGIAKNPYFFKGLLVNPRRTAELMLAVSLVSRTRFYSPGELRERLLAAADPVVTSGGERLRFEAFSVCCGAYARLDLRPEAINGEWVGRGTTNVDFNGPMRASLANILPTETVGLNVGTDGLELEKASEKIVERKVKLPVRWLKGFVEVQSYQSQLKPRLELSAAHAKRFFSNLPRQELWYQGLPTYIVPAGSGVRLSQRETNDAIAVGGAGRLKVFQDIVRQCNSVRVYSGEQAVTGWEFLFDDCCLFLVLSPSATRGCSGEGQALSQLARADGADALSKIRAALQWDAKIDADRLSAHLKIDRTEIQSALAMLGARGLVGYDLSEGAYFHRELPFDLELVEELQPRLQNARKLVEENGVRIVRNANGEIEAYVQGTDVEHRVMFDDKGARCTCPWYSKHPGERGECKHMLAVEIVIGGEQ